MLALNSHCREVAPLQLLGWIETMNKIYISTLSLVIIAIFLIIGQKINDKKTSSEHQAHRDRRQVETTSSTLEETPKVRSRRDRRSDREPTIREVWGEIIDPAEDCHFSMKDGKLRTWVPGSETPHDMNPEAGTTGSNDAPRLLQPVTGDFSIQVKIGGEFAPGEESTQPGFTGYSGAGLLVMADDLNFVRLERASLQYVGSEEEPYTNFEIRVNGVTERWGDTSDFPTEADKSTWLRLERRGNEIHGSMSQDGINWISTEPKLLPPEAWNENTIQAGVLAVSTSKQVFNPEFSELVIENAESSP